MKESGWIFDKINSMKISFYKTRELDGTSYVKIPLRSSAILNIQNNDKYCFIWSILASLHPCENTHPSRVNNYIQYFNEIVKELSNNFARLINQNKFRYQTFFSARFDKQDENNQILDETEIFINLNINHNLTQSDLDKIDVVSPLKHQIQQQEMKDRGWRFDKINSMTLYFYQTGIMNGSNYVKIPLRSNAILNIENNDKYCFIWSILAHLHQSNNNHPDRVTNYKQLFDELNFRSFDFTNGFKCSDVHKLNELNNLSVNINELNFYKDGDKWKHNLIPIEISKNESDNIIDLLIYKNHYALIKKLHVFLGDHNKSFVCRRCLNSYTCENALKNHKEKFGDDNKCTIRIRMNLIIIGKNIFIRIHYILGLSLISKLIMKKIILG